MNYYRCDADSLGLSLDKVDPESIKKLKGAGEGMWKDCQADLKKMIEQILTEKYS